MVLFSFVIMSKDFQLTSMMVDSDENQDRYFVDQQNKLLLHGKKTKKVLKLDNVTRIFIVFHP